MYVALALQDIYNTTIAMYLQSASVDINFSKLQKYIEREEKKNNVCSHA